MILVAIGANLPDAAGRPPREACAAAAAALGALSGGALSGAGLAGLRLAALSSWWRSAPIPPSGQPDYINGVARLEGAAEPAALLAALQALEAEAGRVRGVANAARPLDLDLIDLDGIVRDAPDPVLPHPRAHLRAFVLRPLAEVAPDWRHPRLGLGLAEMLAGVADQRLTRL